MASLKKPDQSAWPDSAGHLYQCVADTLTAHCKPSSSSLLIAYSGGLDSHVLLVAAQRWGKLHHVPVRAIYIDHQLQVQSAVWGEHCVAVCEQLEVPCDVIRVTVNNANGASPESAAREARYSVFKEYCDADVCLLTAHHADDQAETLLLQLLRGAGIQGLASMPVCKPFSGGRHLRPLLSITRDELHAAAVAMTLQWVEDKSNADIHYDRNYLRHQVLPLLKQRWPSAVKTIGRSAGHIAKASVLLNALASQEVELESDVLSVSDLRDLSYDRRANALRAWISRQGFTMPSTATLSHVSTDLVMAGADTDGQVTFGDAQIRRHRDSLYIGAAGAFDLCEPFSYLWAHRSESLYIPETNQTLSYRDLPLAWHVFNEPLRVTSRQGGEKIQLEGRPYRQSVKSLLQQQGLPPWQRCRLPFIWHREQLIGIIGVGFIAAPAA